MIVKINLKIYDDYLRKICIGHKLRLLCICIKTGPGGDLGLLLVTHGLV